MGRPPPDSGIRAEGLIEIKSAPFARGIRVQIFLDPRILTKRGGAANVTSSLYDHLLQLGCSPEGWGPPPAPPKQHYWISYTYDGGASCDGVWENGEVVTDQHPVAWRLGSSLYRLAITNVLTISAEQAELLRGDPARSEG